MVCVSYMAICVPIVMYGLRLFNVVLQELHCLPNCLHVCTMRVEVAITSPSFIALPLLVSEIAKCRLFNVVLQEQNYLLQRLLLLLWCVH